MSFNKNKGSPWVPAGMAATTVNPQVGAAVTGFGMAQNRMQKDTELKKPSPPQVSVLMIKSMMLPLPHWALQAQLC